MTSQAPTAVTVTGLSAAEVEQRRAAGKSNDVPNPTSRTVRQIVRANVLTPFNFLLGTLLVIIIAVGEFKDALFGIVLVANTLIG
ncbi:MAG: cation-translocating P-type ATPase, partial [Acidimicrobiales bacterium]